MKFTSKERKLTSNKKTMSVELGLGDTKKAIELLYSQYRNPIRTCVQELVSNAFDAMQDAGKADQPIKIQLPNAVNEFYLSVRDFGNSMDEETIKNVYMRVNTSTKSNSNNAIGGFGIGSKTPWAYTDTYILKTFLNGLETQYALIKGRSSVQIVYQGETTQENGTEVIFKIRENDEQRFAEAVKRISLCAKTKPKINSDMSLDFEDVDVLSPSVSVVSSKILKKRSVYINLGGVLYHADSNMFSTSDSWRNDENYNAVRNLITNSASLIISLPIGSVMPLQTREGLFSEGDEGKQNKAMLKRMIKNAKEVIESTMNVREKEVISIESAIKYFSKGLLSSSKRFEFGNITVTSKGFDIMKAGLYSEITRKSKHGWGRKNKTGRKNTSYVLYHSNLVDTVYFSEVSANKARLVSRFHDLSYNREVIVLEKDNFKDLTVYEFLKKYTNAVDIHTVEIPKKASTRAGKKVDKTRVVLHHCVSDSGTYYKNEFFLTDDWDKKTVVISRDSYPKHSTKLYQRLGYDIWRVAETNVKKLVEHDPKVFLTEDKAIEEKIDKVLKMYIKYRYSRAVEHLKTREHVDFVLKFAEATKKNLNTSTSYVLVFKKESDIVEKLHREYGKFIDKAVKKMIKGKIRVYNIVDKAPLVQHINYLGDVKGQAKTDLENYIKTALNA